MKNVPKNLNRKFFRRLLFSFLIIGVTTLAILITLTFFKKSPNIHETAYIPPSPITEDISDKTMVKDSLVKESEVPVANIVTNTLPETETEEFITLGFAGDFNLDDNSPTTAFMNSKENGIQGCISSKLISLINSYDLFMLNNEFVFSDQGSPLEGKMYTFRSNPENVSVLAKLGVDVVLLANNHVYDYGENAFYDTLTTLENADIEFVGAGKNLTEAKKILYKTFGDYTIAYVAATRAEKYIMTPEATQNSPGVLRCYDYSTFISIIEEADAHADYVVANVHFGTEYSNSVEDYQKEMAHAFVDAGADCVIGTHPHVLQGMEYYNGCPIIYSLGNFWFNDKDLYSGVLQITLNASAHKTEKVVFIPCTQYDCYTDYPQDFSEQREIWDYMETISFDIQIDDMGNVVEKQ